MVSIPFSVPALTLDTFTDDVKQSLFDAIAAALPATANVQIYITNIRSGTVYFDTVVEFLDGDQDAATTLVETARAVSTSEGPSAHLGRCYKEAI